MTLLTILGSLFVILVSTWYVLTVLDPDDDFQIFPFCGPKASELNELIAQASTTDSSPPTINGAPTRRGDRFSHRQRYTNKKKKRQRRIVLGGSDLYPSSDSDVDDHLCIMCLSSPRSVILLPCRHLLLCRRCGGWERRRCPKCYAEIRMTLVGKM